MLPIVRYTITIINIILVVVLFKTSMNISRPERAPGAPMTTELTNFTIQLHGQFSDILSCLPISITEEWNYRTGTQLVAAVEVMQGF